MDNNMQQGPASTPDEGITLPSGAKAVIRKGKGRDLFNAQRKAESVNELVWFLLAELVEVNGRPVIIEELYDMDLPDVMMLMEQIGNFTPPPGSISSISLPSPAGPTPTSP